MKNLQNIPQCADCITHLKSPFRHLTPDELENLFYAKECQVRKRGSVVYREGSRMSGFFCVSKGVLKLYKTGVEGKEQIIRFAKKGEIIGYRSVLSNEAACTSAKVIEDAVLCFIPSETLFDLVKNNSDFSMAIMKLTCRELKEANSFITEIAQKSVRERLAEVLILLIEKFSLDEESALKISLTREELANIVGTATESVIRLLSEFKEDKLIELQGRKIKILDIKGLEKTGNILR